MICLALGPGLAAAQNSPAAKPELELRLERCAVLGDASARLACYDGLAGSPVDMAAATQPLPPPAVVALPTTLAALTTIAPEAEVSAMVQSWELDRASKHGAFNFRPYHDNYLLLTNYSTSSNDGPYKDRTPAGIASQHTELTYQISFKMKLLEQVMGTPVDFWFAYTQQSFWQAYNRAASSPFRETNYQPELMAATPFNVDLGVLNLRYINLGVVHQSNGQTSTLSRSWNRVYVEVGAEHGKLGLTYRLWKRLDNARSNNDNLDIADYMGNGDLRATYRQDGNEWSLMARRNFKKKNGALQLGWAFPVRANLKGYLQAFSGYGESLIDYNYAQKSIGAGFLVDF